MNLRKTSTESALTAGSGPLSSIGLRVYLYRRRAGFRSTRDLASHLANIRISSRSLQAIEQNRRNPTVVELLEISNALEVSPLALLIDLDRPFETLDIQGLGASLSSKTGDDLIDLMSPSLPEGSGSLQREQEALWWIAQWRTTYRDAHDGVQAVRSHNGGARNSSDAPSRDLQFAANARILAEDALDVLQRGGIDVAEGQRKLTDLTTN